MKRFLFLLLCFPTVLTAQWRMVSSSVSLNSTVDDSTYVIDVNFFSDLTGSGYLATGITADFLVFSQSGELYDITAATNLTLSSGRLTIVEVDNDYVDTEGAPTGQIIVYDPQGEYIPVTPFGNSNMGNVLQGAAIAYNSKIKNQLAIATIDDTSSVISPYEGQLVYIKDAGNYQVRGAYTWSALDPGGGGSGDVTGPGSATNNAVARFDGTGGKTVQNSSVTIDDGGNVDIPGNITVTGDVDGRDIAADGTKLDGIESGATADQTDGEIETAYNSQVSVVDQSTAETGTSTTVYRWTPERVKQAIDANAAGLSEETNAAGGENLYKLDGTATANEIADYISGVRVPVAQNWKMSDTVSVPSGFTFDPGFSIWRNGKKFSTAIDQYSDFRDSFWLGGKAYYVDPIMGDNGNSGTSKNSPLETVAAAIAKPDIDVLYLKGTIYPGVSFFTTGNDSLSIIGYDGTPVVGSIDAQKTWSTTAYTGVYSTTTSDSLSWPLDLLRRGDMGEFVRLRNAGDASNCENNPGTYAYDATGTTLYIHASDGLEPDTYSNILIIDNGIKSLNTSNNVYIENIEYYGSMSIKNASANVRIRDASFFYAPQVDLLTFDSCNVVLSNIVLGHCQTDCIDYGAEAQGVELNCYGRYGGYDNSGSDNQISTAHESAQVITINCDYSLASNESILDVNAGTQRWILGGRFGGAWNQEAGSYVIGVGNLPGNTSNMWIEGAEIGGNEDYDFQAEYGTIYIRNVPINAATRVNLLNGGTIEKY